MRVTTIPALFLPVLEGSPTEGPLFYPRSFSPWSWEIPGLCFLAGLENRDELENEWNKPSYTLRAINKLEKRFLLLADTEVLSLMLFLLLLLKRMMSHPTM